MLTLTPNGLPAYDTLYQEGDNRVVYCYECGVFHVYYATVCVDINRRSLDVLANSLDAYYACYESTEDRFKRCIEVGTPCSTIRFVLSVEDLHLFSGMLRQAAKVYDERKQALSN
ncbi:MAG: hypothetical protein AAF597_05605 [Bacteroidota bacterium]